MPEPHSTPTYASLIAEATRLLYRVSDSPKIDSELLLLHVVQKPMAWLVAHGDSLASSDESREFFAQVGQRHEGQPIAYLLGYKEFWSLKLKVNEHVLIPRPDTETLVEQALQRLDKDRRSEVLDLGTGSGAIALAIAKERPLANVLAVDSQQNALDVAKENARTAGLNNVDFLLGNWFDNCPASGFDLIAANPPYVRAEDPHLQQGDLRFEPDSALIGGGDGFDDLRKIISAAPAYLRNHGWLLVEHGLDQNQLVDALFIGSGFANISLHRDLNGHPRCTAGQRSV